MEIITWNPCSNLIIFFVIFIYYFIVGYLYFYQIARFPFQLNQFPLAISFLYNWQQYGEITAILTLRRICTSQLYVWESPERKKDIDMQMIVLNFIERVHLS